MFVACDIHSTVYKFNLFQRIKCVNACIKHNIMCVWRAILLLCSKLKQYVLYYELHVYFYQLSVCVQ